jgi:hypothetical protein
MNQQRFQAVVIEIPVGYGALLVVSRLESREPKSRVWFSRK